MGLNNNTLNISFYPNFKMRLYSPIQPQKMCWEDKRAATKKKGDQRGLILSLSYTLLFSIQLHKICLLHQTERHNGWMYSQSKAIHISYRLLKNIIKCSVYCELTKCQHEWRSGSRGWWHTWLLKARVWVLFGMVMAQEIFKFWLDRIGSVISTCAVEVPACRWALLLLFIL